MKAADKNILFGYWNNRTLVTTIDEADNAYDYCRVKVVDYCYVQHFFRYYNLNLEIWRV